MRNLSALVPTGRRRSASPDLVPAPAKKKPEHFHVGTLVYTKGTLVALFAVMLWGDFCWSIMESVTPSVLTLKLSQIGASNWLVGLVMTTIPKMVETVMNPVASFWSDRFRSRWGRRIPFLFGSTPFLVLFLVLLGFSDDIAHWIYSLELSKKLSETDVTLCVIATFVIGFQFFNSFTISIYYYLFNDVVPHHLLARFFSLFRVASGVAGISYNYFVLPFADHYGREIFLAASVIYLFGFSSMCWNVKEGEYPNPTAYVGGKRPAGRH